MKLAKDVAERCPDKRLRQVCVLLLLLYYSCKNGFLVFGHESLFLLDLLHDTGVSIYRSGRDMHANEATRFL